MRRTTCIASAALIALATIALNGCGADDSPPASNASTTAPAPNDAAQPPATAAAPTPNASAPFADHTANDVSNSTASNAASGAAAADPITQNIQASLAADSQQVTPVMRYAPGDSANN